MTASWFCLSTNLIADEHKFIAEIQLKHPDASHTFVQSIWATASTLIPHLPHRIDSSRELTQNGVDCFEFSPALLSLVPKRTNLQLRVRDVTQSPISSPTSSLSESFLPTLVRTAFVAASGLQCPSILAGRSSESDEFADVGVYVGPGDYGVGKEEEILEQLGLTPWIHRHGGKIVPITTTGSTDTLSPSLPFPASLAAIPKSDFQSTLVKPSIDSLSALLSRLTNRHEFRVEANDSERLILHFLLGQLLPTPGREELDLYTPSIPIEGSLCGAGAPLDGTSYDHTSLPNGGESGLGVWVGLASISIWGY